MRVSRHFDTWWMVEGIDLVYSKKKIHFGFSYGIAVTLKAQKTSLGH